MTVTDTSSSDRQYRMQLADALCARLCHDLASPLGTLMNALELAADDPDSLEDALPLANETAVEMGSRLRLLRTAWAGDCGPQSTAQLVELAAGLPSRVKADLSDLPATTFDGPVARALINLLLLGAEALPRGGVVALSGSGSGEILVTVSGKAAAWPAGLPQALIDPMSVSLDNPRAVQPPITVLLAQDAGRRLSILMTPNPDPNAVPPLLLATN
ncbi:histidine phosphotransferase family protein [Acidisphaera sp. L21]|uniref:histidine phosphotransferase family protein n=1 Tax=Acidisphaera sp. L21 TaxID=1641851 RepID=UPI00131D97A9|nr:histidine phosphotransferase family protein [Acidisphaera sp. L21]